MSHPAVKHHNRCASLESILSSSGVSPSRRIQAALLLRPDIDPPTLRTLASRLGRSSVHMSFVINGHRPSDPLKEAIAAELLVGKDAIWPASTEELESSASMAQAPAGVSENHDQEVTHD